MASIPSEHENAQKLKSTGETKQQESLHVVKTENDSDILQLLESFQKMKAEEQRLVDLKAQILVKQRALQDTLVREMEKMKVSIAGLSSEIPDLETKTRKLGEALGVGNGGEEELVSKLHSSNPVPEEDEDLPDCVGLINCSKPEKCDSYDSCLKNYVAAEMRNEVPRF